MSKGPFKVLIVSQYFWPENFRINDFAKALVERGHTVTVLTGKPNYPQGSFFAGYRFWGIQEENYEGVKIVRVPLVSRGHGRGLRLAINYFSYAFFAVIFGVWKTFFKKYDLIFAYQLSPITLVVPAIVLKWLKRVPLYIWVQDLWPESLEATGAIHSKKVLLLVGQLVDFIYSQCDCIFVQSRRFIEVITDRGVPQNKIIYMPNWAENIFTQKVLIDTEKLPKFSGEFKILFAGNIGEAQGFPALIQAALLLKEDSRVQWYILGDGRKREWVEQEIQKLGLKERFHLMGRYPLETMPHFFEQADALLVSLKREPIFALTIPGKIQSYLASGQPILACIDGEGAAVIKEAGAGYAAPAEDAEGLVKNIKKMLELNLESRKAMGISGQKYFLTHFDRELVIDNFEKFIQSRTR